MVSNWSDEAAETHSDSTDHEDSEHLRELREEFQKMTGDGISLSQEEAR